MCTEKGHLQYDKTRVLRKGPNNIRQNTCTEKGTQHYGRVQNTCTEKETQQYDKTRAPRSTEKGCHYDKHVNRERDPMMAKHMYSEKD